MNTPAQIDIFTQNEKIEKQWLNKYSAAEAFLCKHIHFRDIILFVFTVVSYPYKQISSKHWRYCFYECRIPPSRLALGYLSCRSSVARSSGLKYAYGRMYCTLVSTVPVSYLFSSMVSILTLQKIDIRWYLNYSYESSSDETGNEGYSAKISGDDATDNETNRAVICTADTTTTEHCGANGVDD